MTRPTMMPLWVVTRGGTIVWVLLVWESIMAEWQDITDTWDNS